MHQPLSNTAGYGRARRSHMRVSMPDNHSKPAAEDPGLRRMMKWVFGALILTVAVAILVVEMTLRWFGER